jgi:hypothetical protein
MPQGKAKAVGDRRLIFKNPVGLQDGLSLTAGPAIHATIGFVDPNLADAPVGVLDHVDLIDPACRTSHDRVFTHQR